MLADASNKTNYISSVYRSGNQCNLHIQTLLLHKLYILENEWLYSLCVTAISGQSRSSYTLTSPTYCCQLKVTTFLCTDHQWKRFKVTVLTSFNTDTHIACLLNGSIHKIPHVWQNKQQLFSCGELEVARSLPEGFSNSLTQAFICEASSALASGGACIYSHFSWAHTPTVYICSIHTPPLVWITIFVSSRNLWIAGAV